jgi:hypothetical protein
MPFLRKYGTGSGSDVIIPIIKRGVVDFAVTADWTPASGDVKVSKDGGTEANIGTLPVINGTVGWKFVFSDAELQCKSLTVRVVDSATKAVEDQFFVVETYGHASAMFVVDFSTAAFGAVMPTTAGRTLAVSAAGAVELDSASRLAIWNTLTTETFTANSFGDLLIISDGTNGREVKVTGAGHIAAVIHDVQPNGLSGSTQISNIENASGYLLAVLAGACADPQTASETYAITVFGSTFTVDMAGQTSTGTRTAPTLTKT